MMFQNTSILIKQKSKMDGAKTSLTKKKWRIRESNLKTQEKKMAFLKVARKWATMPNATDI